MHGFSSEEYLKSVLHERFGYADDEMHYCSGVMGVPITFLDKYNPDEFEIIGITNHGDMSGIPFVNNCFAEIRGKRKYVRLFIRRKS